MKESPVYVDPKPSLAEVEAAYVDYHEKLLAAGGGGQCTFIRNGWCTFPGIFSRYCNILAYMILFMCLLAAQPRAFGAAASLDSIRPLQIGDTIPEELWHMPLQVVNHPEGKETITLNDYKGKLVILDFWGTADRLLLPNW